MLFIAFGCIYATIICWSWGVIGEKLFSFLAPPVLSPRHTILTCFLGLAIISVIAGYLSLFLPLFSLVAQLIIILPALFICVREKPGKVVRTALNRLLEFTWWQKLILAGSVFLLLLMSSWLITHPDSLGYHVQITKWIEILEILINVLFTQCGTHCCIHNSLSIWRRDLVQIFDSGAHFVFTTR